MSDEPNQNSTNQPMSWRGIAYVFLAIAGAGVVGKFAIDWLSSPPTSAEASVVSPLPIATSLGVGTVGQISVSRSVFGFDSRDAIDAAVKSAVAKDEVGYREIVAEHGERLVSAQKALVIEGSWRGVRRIRMNEGPHANEAFWVFVEDIEAVPPPKPEPAPQPEALAQVKAFFDWIAKSPDGTVSVTIPPEGCEKSGPSRGLCENHAESSVGGSSYTTYFFKDLPQAIRFSTHVGAKLSCDQLGARTLQKWEQRPGALNVAAGSICAFSDKPGGYQLLIENNRTPDGAFATGLHVYSPDYVRRDKSFAEALERDRAGAHL
jgi:hypothetical protein